MNLNLLKPHPDFMHRAEPTEQARTIKVFSDIVRRDRGSAGDADGRYKQRACQELAYIYHMCDFRSPYFNVPEEDRSSALITDIFGDDDWEPDELVQEGLELYQELTQTPSMRLLDAAQVSVAELERYFRDVDFDETDEKGKYKYTAKDLMSNLEKLSKLVDSLSDLRKQVEKEQQVETENWGGVQLNEFNKGNN